jgi:hypothetical protein
MDIQISFPASTFNSLGHIPEAELLEHLIAFLVTFEGIAILFSIAGVPFYIPTSGE